MSGPDETRSEQEATEQQIEDLRDWAAACHHRWVRERIALLLDDRSRLERENTELRAEHVDWCNEKRHGDCCGDECDCGAGAVNDELATLRAERDALAAENEHLRQYVQALEGDSDQAIIDMDEAVEAESEAADVVIHRLTAQRDALAEAVQRVRELIESWPEHDAESVRFSVYNSAVKNCKDALRRALAGLPVDVTPEEGPE